MMPTTLQPFDTPTLCRNIAKFVKRNARRWRLRREEIQDVIQEALATILARAAMFPAGTVTFDTWTRGIAFNVGRQHARGRRRFNARFAEQYTTVYEHPSSDPSPERCVQRKQAFAEISRAVETLSAKQARVLVMHGVDDVPHREIGHALAMSVDATQKCFQRACNRMAECVSIEHRATMPLDLAACDDSTFRRPATSKSRRFEEWSHYAGQVASMLLILFIVPVSIGPRAHAWSEGPILDGTSSQNDAMYTLDKRFFVLDEQPVRSDAPTGKPDPAFLRSASRVVAPTRTVGKLSPTWTPSPLPPYKHGPPTKSYRPRAWREPLFR